MPGRRRAFRIRALLCELRGFDDSAWPEVAAADLGAKRGGGMVSFFWFRTTLTIPVTAVLRINGQFFAYVADQGQGGLVAHQRAVTLGTVIGNDYVVAGGLKPGEKLIVSGIQKMGDGSPVQPAAPASAPPAASAGQGGR